MPVLRFVSLVGKILLLAICCNLAATQNTSAGDINTTPPNSSKNPIVDTGQVSCYNATRIITCPKPGKPFYGQDAQYEGIIASYRDNGDRTITDLNTGLVWSKAVDKTKVSLAEAKQIAHRMRLGGYGDWRVPNIKELYSLIDFRGYIGSPGRDQSMSQVPPNAIPFINTDYFDFAYGDIARGERYIDAQWLSSTEYVSTTMHGAKTLFGVNFADGRIKGYGYQSPRGRREKKFYARYVRGNPLGKNDFQDNGDGTVTDRVTGLMWTKQDSGRGMNWPSAMAYAENLVYAGYDDWRLPNAKELQYIVDYSRSPDTTNSAAIAPIFSTTSITNEAGKKDFPYSWSSTTHLDGPHPGKNAAYVAFGRALGKMHGTILDVHWAGAQRSDPKTGKTAQWRGPQGDARRVKNYVRCVRGGPVKTRTATPRVDKSKYPYNVKTTQGTKRSVQSGEQRRFASPPGGASGVGRFVRRLDRNGDGRVSRSEFDGPRHHFGILDRNRDGFLSEDEAPRRPPPRR